MSNKNDFLKAEYRCDFYVDEKRKKLWKIELDMLDWLNELCEKNNIDYFMICGSALGAVRHQGFIPWDDDIDVGMLRENAEKFLDLTLRTGNMKYFVQYELNDNGHFNGLIRIRNKNTTGIIVDDYGKVCNQGIFIEIYVFDRVSDNEKERIRQLKKSKFWYAVLSRSYYDQVGIIRNIVAKTVARILGRNKCYNIWQKICTQYNKYETEYVNNIAFPYYGLKNTQLYKYQDVCKCYWVPFEYTKCMIAIGTNEILIAMYGDYMQYPPIKMRGLNHAHIVFYDPDVPYEEYLNSIEVKKYFGRE